MSKLTILVRNLRLVLYVLMVAWILVVGTLELVASWREDARPEVNFAVAEACRTEAGKNCGSEAPVP